MKSISSSERRFQSLARNASSRRRPGGAEEENEDGGSLQESLQPPNRSSSRRHQEQEQRTNSSTSRRERGDPAMAKTHNFDLVSHNVGTMPSLTTHSYVQQPQATANRLEMFSARPPDEEETLNSSSWSQEEDTTTSSRDADTVPDLQAPTPHHPIGAYAIRGHTIQPRTVGRAAPPASEGVSLFSSPTEQPQQPVVIAAQVRDSQIQGEVRRVLSNEDSASSSSGYHDEIHDQIDDHVRRILAENAVPAEAIVTASQQEESRIPSSVGAEPKQEPLQKKLCRNKMLLIALLVVLIGIVVIAVAIPLAMSSSSNNNNDRPPATLTPPVTNTPPPNTLKPQTPPPSTTNPVVTADPTVAPAPTVVPTTAPPTNRPTSVPVWLQVGKGIEGIDGGAIFGNSVSINGNGTIVAAGAPQSNLNGPFSGYAAVHRYNATTLNWERLGQVIGGNGLEEFSGWSVSLNDEGNILAVSADGVNQVRVYQYDEAQDTWLLLGQFLNGKSDGARFGSTVALSGDGSVLVASSIGTESPGYVRAYRFVSPNWEQLGNDLIAPAVDGDGVSGYSLSVSTGGTLLAIGADEMPIEGTGLVQVYEYNGTEWIQLGQDLRGDAPKDYFGHSVSLDNTGSRLAVGAISDSSVASGYVRVYQYSAEGGWNQIGNTLNGFVGDEFGYSVSLKGDTLAVGARRSGNKNGEFAGKTLLYQYDGSDWRQVGQPILGANGGDQSGVSVSLSGDDASSSMVAIGSRQHDGPNGLDSGHVRIYNLK